MKFNTHNSALYMGRDKDLDLVLEKCKYGAYNMPVRCKIEILSKPYSVLSTYTAHSWDLDTDCQDNAMAIDIRCKNIGCDGKVSRNWDYISLVYASETIVLNRVSARND